MEYLNFIVTPAFTAGFFVLDLSQKNDLFYNWFQKFFKAVLSAYIAFYLGVGLIFYGAYYWGIHLLDKDPNEIVQHYITKQTPPWLNDILIGIVVAWFAHGFCTSRTIPGFDSTIEVFIERKFFRDFRSDLEDDRNKGRLNFSKRLIHRYNKKYKTDLDLISFGKKIENYIKDNRATIKPEQMAEFQVMGGDMESASSIDIAVYIALVNFTPKKIKVILDI